uniref:Lasioglossin-2 n=1 Tax=Lasioglossum laticeps TaxID=88510 RepID=LL2_LASLA|nr:RecName: Full=Lasioglossin-2; Short=LL-II [Lasioglossum laticeps]
VNWKKILGKIIKVAK